MAEKKIYLEVEVITNPKIKDIICFDADEFETISAKHTFCEVDRWQRLKEFFLIKFLKKKNL